MQLREEALGVLRQPCQLLTSELAEHTSCNGTATTDMGAYEAILRWLFLPLFIK